MFLELFDHQSFTGRSGAFYGYEGLGSIYWHMVSKLLLTTQECFFRAVNGGADPVTIGKIKDHYYEIKAGIGLYKSPELYGAFPTDAYSHTPANAGAQQPGMTGQVKEDIVARMHEIGIHIQNGEIVLQSSLFNPEELLRQECVFDFFDLKGQSRQIILHEGQFGFTFCQIPVIFTASNEDKITVTRNDGKQILISGHIINTELSNSIFQRTGDFDKLEVSFKDLR